MRHIIIIDTATQWRVVHPKGFGDAATTPREDADGCHAVQVAAEEFMRPLPIRRPAVVSLRSAIRWAILSAMALAAPPLPVDPGAYWCEAVDGNLHIGGRLPAAAAFAYAGDLR